MAHSYNQNIFTCHTLLPDCAKLGWNSTFFLKFYPLTKCCGCWCFGVNPWLGLWRCGAQLYVFRVCGARPSVFFGVSALHINGGITVGLKMVNVQGSD